MIEESTAEEFEAQCPGEVCIQKCCAAGFHLFNTTCIPTQLQWEPTFYEGDDLFIGEVAHTVLYGKTNCEDGETFIFSERLGELDAPYVQTNGKLHVTGLNLTFEAHQCCLEYETYYNLKTQRNDIAEIAFCCFPYDKEAGIMAAVNNVLLTLSAICLFVMLAIYMLVPDLRNIHGKCLMSHAAALFVAFFLTVYNQFARIPLGDSCEALGMLLYYSFIAALFWLNVMSFDIWWTFAPLVFRHLRTQPPSERSLRHRFIRHSLYAWGVPLVMTGLLAFFNYAPTSVIPDGTIVRPGIGERQCFLSTPEGELYYFYIPIFIVTGVNIIFFIATAWTLYKAEQNSRILQRKRTARDRLKVYVNLFIIMEVSWIAECLSTQIEPKQLWYFTDIINASQGTLIFLLFIVRSSTRRAIKNRFLELTKYGFNPSARKVRPAGRDDQNPPSSRTKTTGSGNSGASRSAQSDGIPMTDVQQGGAVKTGEANSDNSKATPCNPDKSTHDNPC
ncbi:probable G-protein coupled receptor Mth-like 3 isoform X1 [Pollicipes pollicipes]|uniref:probable G-protein coupled receptor Mth-like 3 isoform X1 n=1 Tax=Pollicipes pollicipes TaxID=41117 RepID=UPI0018859FFB|nr:probable G-protein coupled receptor Mth-like 3 isoform X1 [Pollicipes pollicipes]